MTVDPKAPAHSPLKLPCRCAGCRTPFAVLLPDGRLAIASEHHGQRHINTLSLAELVQLRQSLEVAPTAS